MIYLSILYMITYIYIYYKSALVIYQNVIYINC